MSDSLIRSTRIGSIYIQSGYGVPTHINVIGSLYVDQTNAVLYINKNGINDWEYFFDSSQIIPSGVDVFVTGGTYDSITSTITFTNNTGGTFTVTGLTSGSGAVFSGGTVTGPTIFTNGLSANTISATTYYNLPIDVFVTGGTYSGSTIIFKNNTGGTFNVTGITASGGLTGDYLPLSGGTVTGTTYFTAGLSANTFSAQTIQFDTGYTGTTSVGMLNWNQDFGTLEQGLFGGNVIQKIGESIYAYVHNAEATTLNLGEVVYIYGANGDKISVKRAANTGDTTSSKTLGVVAESIPAGGLGYVITQGTLDKLNLGSYTAGDVVWLSSTPGQFTKTKQYAPYHLVFVGVVQRANAGNGQLYVKPQNGYELEELHNVAATGATYGDLIVYSASNGNNLWVNSKVLTGNYTINGGITITGKTVLDGTTAFTLNVTGSTVLDSTTANTLNVTGSTILNTLSATTISATTYQNLPRDVFVTGGTYSGSASTLIFTNNTGGTFNVTGITATGGGTFTGGTVTGPTFFTGGLSANTISATTYQNLPTDIRVTGSTYSNNTFTYTNNTGGTFTVLFNTLTGLTVNGNLTVTGTSSLSTISATTYQNLPRDVFVTGGTYNSGTSTITFRNSTGGTFTVTGITAGGGSGSVSGTVNYVAKFTGTTGVGNSIIYDNGTNVGIGTTSPAQKLDVNGDALINSITVGRKSDLTTTIVGNTALDSLVGGNSNTVYGYQSGRYITNGNNNLIIGYLNYKRPDSVNITNESNILSISKNSDLNSGYPQIWSPTVTYVANLTVANILEMDPTKYSALFLEYVIEDKNSSNMRAGTIKAVFLIDLSKIEWSEETLPEINDTTNYTFNVKNNGSGTLVVELTNNGSDELVCNYTSRLILRHYT